MEITKENNFCRVFEIPKDFLEGYLFSGPASVNFSMVDWFNPIPSDEIGSDNVKPWSEYVEMLKEFILEKKYSRKGYSYLLLTDFNESLIVESN